MDKITRFIRLMDRRVKYIPLNFTIIECIWFALFLFIFVCTPYYNIITILLYGLGCLYLGIMSNEIKALKEIEKAMKANDNKWGSFSDPNYTLGWISAVVKRELDK